MDLIKLEELKEYLQNAEGSQGSAKGVELFATEKPIKQKAWVLVIKSKKPVLNLLSPFCGLWMMAVHKH